MKLLIISEKYYPEGSGAEFATYLITKILSKYADVTLVSAPGAKPPENVRLITVPLYRERMKGHIINSMMITRLKSLIESHDIIYIPRTCYQFIPVAKKLNKKVIVHMHDYYGVTYNSILWMDEKLNKFSKDHIFYGRWIMGGLQNTILSVLPSLLNKFIDRSLLKYADVIVCASYFHADIIKKLLGEYSGSIITIYNPLPEDILRVSLSFEDLRRKYEDKIFTYIGPPKVYKGFIHALAILRALNVNARFIGVSDSSTLNLIKRKIPNAEVYPRLPHFSYLNKLKESYAVLLPFMCQESMSYTMIEAVILGNLPIVRRIGVSIEFFGDSELQKFLFQSNSEAIMNVKRSLHLNEKEYYYLIIKGVKVLKEKIKNEEIEKRWKMLLDYLLKDLTTQ